MCSPGQWKAQGKLRRCGCLERFRRGRHGSENPRESQTGGLAASPRFISGSSSGLSPSEPRRSFPRHQPLRARSPHTLHPTSSWRPRSGSSPSLPPDCPSASSVLGNPARAVRSGRLCAQLSRCCLRSPGKPVAWHQAPEDLSSASLDFTWHIGARAGDQVPFTDVHQLPQDHAHPTPYTGPTYVLATLTRKASGAFSCLLSPLGSAKWNLRTLCATAFTLFRNMRLPPSSSFQPQPQPLASV